MENIFFGNDDDEVSKLFSKMTNDLINNSLKELEEEISAT